MASSVIWMAITFILLYVSQLLACPCDTTGILAFNVSLHRKGENATVMCCAQDGYDAGVYYLRENNVPEEVISYFRRLSCDGIVFSLTNIQCSSRLTCHSLKRGGDENEVIVSVGSLISCTNPLSNTEIDALQHCPCLTTEAPTSKPSTASSSSASSTVDKEVFPSRTSSESASFIDTKPNNGNLVRVTASSVVTVTLLIVFIVAIIIVVIIIVMRRRTATLKNPVQDNQLETDKLLFRKFLGLNQVDSSQAEACHGPTDIQKFITESHTTPAIETQTLEGTEGKSIECTDGLDIRIVVDNRGKGVVRFASDSRPNATNFIPDDSPQLAENARDYIPDPKPNATNFIPDDSPQLDENDRDPPNPKPNATNFIPDVFPQPDENARDQTSDSRPNATNSTPSVPATSDEGNSD